MLRFPPRFKQVASTSLAVVFGVVAGVDIVGTPLAIIAINHAASASDRADSFGRHLGAAVVRSREEDCRSQERLRGLARKRLRKREAETLGTLKLLHVEPTPSVLARAHREYAEERAFITPVNCAEYGKKAAPGD